MKVKFEGNVLIAVGINDSMHATEMCNFKIDEHNKVVNTQNFDALFKLLDETLSKLFPKANIKLSPLIATKDELWTAAEICQEVFIIINGLIRERNHVEFDSYLPLERNWISNDGVHFKDYDGVKFWKSIFEQI